MSRRRPNAAPTPPQPVRLTPRELAYLRSIVTPAQIALRAGSASEEAHQTLATAIVYAWNIASQVQRHRHLMPDIAAANEAAKAGWKDHNAIDIGAEIYLALLKTTPRKTLARIMNATSERFIAEAGAETHATGNPNV